MKLLCPRCHTANRSVAHFCGHCGLALEAVRGGIVTPGRIARPDALPAPEGFEPVGEAANLYFRWESAWGGSPLVGTESLAVILFNGGYALQTVVLNVRAVDTAGRQVLSIEHEVAELPHGQEVVAEIPSYELPAPVHELTVALVRAEFTPLPEEPA